MKLMINKCLSAFTHSIVSQFSSLLGARPDMHVDMLPEIPAGLACRNGSAYCQVAQKWQ
jgi:hypothetical protein